MREDERGMPMIKRTPVELLSEGDMVRAVVNGPCGKVIDANRAGWTLVQYPTRNHWNGAGLMPYRHGEDRLIRADAVQRDEAGAQTEALAEALERLERSFARMPDAGFSDDDPRWGWWHETADDRQHAYETLRAYRSSQESSDAT